MSPLFTTYVTFFVRSINRFFVFQWNTKLNIQFLLYSRTRTQVEANWLSCVCNLSEWTPEHIKLAGISVISEMWESSREWIGLSLYFQSASTPGHYSDLIETMLGINQNDLELAKILFLWNSNKCWETVFIFAKTD